MTFLHGVETLAHPSLQIILNFNSKYQILIFNASLATRVFRGLLFVRNGVERRFGLLVFTGHERVFNFFPKRKGYIEAIFHWNDIDDWRCIFIFYWEKWKRMLTCKNASFWPRTAWSTGMLVFSNGMIPFHLE